MGLEAGIGQQAVLQEADGVLLHMQAAEGIERRFAGERCQQGAQAGQEAFVAKAFESGLLARSGHQRLYGQVR